MTIIPIRDIENHIYTSTITLRFDGNDEITAEQELENIADLPSEIKYSTLKFAEKVTVDEEHIPHIAPDDAEEGTYDIVRVPVDPMITYILNENFEASFSVDSTKLTRNFTAKNSIKDEECLARAQILVWETVMIEEIQRLVELSRRHYDNFTSAVEEISF